MAGGGVPGRDAADDAGGLAAPVHGGLGRKQARQWGPERDRGCPFPLGRIRNLPVEAALPACWVGLVLGHATPVLWPWGLSDP